MTRASRRQNRIERELLQSRSELMDVFRRAPNQMLITRMSDLRIVDVNDAWVRASRYPREVVVGKSSLDFPWWPDPAVRDQLVSTTQKQGYVDAFELTFLDASGEEHVVLMSAQSVTLHGELCVVWQSQDITAIRRAERERRALDERRKQQEKLESLGLLAGGIAHDFNNLLVGVMGNADFMLLSMPEDSPMHAPLRAIAASAERAAGLTRELLDYAGRGSRVLEPVELRALLRDTEMLARPLAPRESALVVELPNEDVYIAGDASQLSRLLLNLAKNGIEALDGRAGHVTLALSLESHGGEERAVVCVSDDGRGMDEDTQKRIFDPFFTTKPHGRGLGLSAVQGIVQRHAGEITVTSAPERGTTFTVHWARRPAPSVEASPRAEDERAARGRVLVVDDEPHVRATVALLLRSFGFEVTEAPGGQQALELLEREPAAFRFVMLDATMPGLDGWTTLQRIRERFTELPVLFCSGYSQQDSATALAGVPHVRFLGKPFRAADLRRAIGSLLPREG